MKKELTYLILVGFITICVGIGCADDGSSGSAGINCGEFGSEHNGHCHCSDGYAFDGTTCVALSAITDLCAEHHEPHEDSDDDEEHHSACVCESTVNCPCEGNLLTSEGTTYCIPELHEE